MDDYHTSRVCNIGPPHQRHNDATNNAIPQKRKQKAAPVATMQGRGPHTPLKQYGVERRIWADISNAMYEASARVAEWIKEGGEQQDKRIWAAVDGIKAYTTA